MAIAIGVFFSEDLDGLCRQSRISAEGLGHFRGCGSAASAGNGRHWRADHVDVADAAPGADTVPMGRTETGLTISERLRVWARLIKRDVHALYLAARDPRTPWFAKGTAIAVAAYALSPLDLIPDFIPVLGYLDDLVIVPAGILLAVKLIPTDLMSEFRAAAASAEAERALGRRDAAVIVLLWIVGVLGAALWVRSWLRG
jgi:uncharacterized membrane protein YkvA (DUF1232 family)